MSKNKTEKNKSGSGNRPEKNDSKTFPIKSTQPAPPLLIMYDKGPRISNLPFCLEQWHSYIVSTYGPGGDFIETMSYKVAEMPKWSTYQRQVNKMHDSAFLDVDDTDDGDSDTSSVASPDNDSEDGSDDGDALAEDVQTQVKKRRKALIQRLFDKAVDETVKQEAIWREVRPKVYAWLISMCHEKVREALMGDSKWERVNDSRDPLKLVKLMKRRLSTEPTKIRADAQERALKAYVACKQNGRALVTFYKDFKERVAHLEEVGITAFEPKTLALAFIKRLNQHYAPLLISIMNKQREEPESLKAAYEMTLELYVRTRLQGGRHATRERGP